MTYTTLTSYTVTVTATDNSGAGPGVGTQTHTINPGQTPTSISISPTLPVVGRGQIVNFTSTVLDQFGNPISGATVNWSVPSAGGGVNPTSGASTQFTASNTVGTYTLSAVAVGGSAPSTSTVISVQANTVTVTPTGQTIGTGATLQFSATIQDPNSQPVTSAITWTIQGGGAGNTIDSSGLFHATGTPGTYTITATDGFTDQGTATVIVNPTAPSFTAGPTATVFITTVSLTAQGSAFGGHPLTYTWSIISAPQGAVTQFSPNGTGTASASIETLNVAGTYTIQCLITDTVNQLTASQNVTFSVSQSLTGLTVSPNNITVQTLQTQQFMAACQDQFGNGMTPCSVTWSTSGGGGVSGAGAFSSPSLGQNIKVTATSNTNPHVSNFAIVDVTSYDVSGAYAYPVPYKASFGTGVITFTGLGSYSSIRIYTASGHKVFDIAVNTNTYPWNVKNSNGENLASGVYLYVIESSQNKKNGKLIIIQ